MTPEDTQDYDLVVRMFRAEHPEWRGDCRWVRLPGEDQPTPIMTSKAMEAFTWWAYE